MRRWLPVTLAALASCHGTSGPAETPAVKQAEALIRQQQSSPSIGFQHVQFTGDAKAGQTCGYFTRPNAIGGTDAVRFIVFADAAKGQNPYIDDPDATFPLDKTEFEPAWQKRCVKLGYKDPNAPATDDKGGKKKG
jgi:hypothetical protein